MTQTDGFRSFVNVSMSDIQEMTSLFTNGFCGMFHLWVMFIIVIRWTSFPLKSFVSGTFSSQFDIIHPVVFIDVNKQHHAFHLIQLVFGNYLYTICFDHSIIIKCTIQKPKIQGKSIKQKHKIQGKSFKLLPWILCFCTVHLMAIKRPEHVVCRNNYQIQVVSCGTHGVVGLKRLLVLWNCHWLV
jgi:hypothetical protein